VSAEEEGKNQDTKRRRGGGGTHFLASLMGGTSQDTETKDEVSEQGSPTSWTEHAERGRDELTKAIHFLESAEGGGIRIRKQSERAMDTYFNDSLRGPTNQDTERK
jgi:hypothetical protein